MNLNADHLETIAEQQIPGLRSISAQRYHHAYIVTTPHASSRQQISRIIAKKMSSGINERDTIGQDEGTITIGHIRELYMNAFRKHGDEEAVRVLYIHSAHHLTLPAQSALLKLLEEPPHGVVFILSITHPSALPATIRSRCIVLRYTPISKKHFMEVLSDSSHSQEATGLFYIFKGDLLAAYQSKNNEQESFSIARQLLSLPLADAVNLAQTITDRSQVRSTFELLLSLSSAAMHSSRTMDKKHEWARNADIILQSIEELDAQVNAKLLLTRRLISLRSRQ